MALAYPAIWRPTSAAGGAREGLARVQDLASHIRCRTPKVRSRWGSLAIGLLLFWPNFFTLPALTG
jgi:hypothetical protein